VNNRSPPEGFLFLMDLLDQRQEHMFRRNGHRFAGKKMRQLPMLEAWSIRACSGHISFWRWSPELWAQTDM